MTPDMEETLDKVRTVVATHKALSSAELTAAMLRAFDKLKADTGTTNLDFSERERWRMSLMFIAGSQYGADAAMDIAKDVFCKGQSKVTA